MKAAAKACLRKRSPGAGDQKPSRSKPEEVHRRLPQGLKPASSLGLFGTTEVVPFPKLFMR
jgi:hypothetical protein